MARLFPRHCVSRSLDMAEQLLLNRILTDGACFLVSAKSVLYALYVDRFIAIKS
jgi:hypothetical protein